MAVGSGALNLEGGGGGDEGLAFEEAAEGVDLGGGPSGKIGEGSFNDTAIKTRGFAEEDGGRGVAVGDGLDVHGYIIKYFYNYNNTPMYNTWVHQQTHMKAFLGATATE
jgi:hypothetical protein